MALPAGVTTATVTVGVPVTHTGGEVKTFVSIEPSADLVHAATGTPLVGFLEELSIAEGVAGQFTLPHTDQAGFTDMAGNAYVNWYYTARVTYSTPSKAKNKTPIVKVFQLTTGQTLVDLDSLPAGAPALPYIAPTATVTAFQGRTGAVELLDTDLPERLSEAELSATYADKTSTALEIAGKAPIVRRGTLATRPAAPAAGSEWIQTDAAGGNLPGTRTFYDGATWSAQQPGQIAVVGCQSNNWFTTMPGPNPNASLTTFASPNAGAGGISLAMFRLSKDITIASLALRKATGAAPYSQSIYRLDGATLTRVATTGELTNPNLDNNTRRDPLLSVVTLTAGTTYYYALTSGTGTFQYYQHTGGSVHTGAMIGLTFGDAFALYQAGAFHPAPATIDTTVGTWTFWQNPPVHFGLSAT